MNPTLEIFSQGEEVVTGQIADTNAAWLSQQAVAMGFTVARHTAVGDKLGDLTQVLIDISDRTDCCICTGGLGPTSDDLTAEAVAKAFGLPLEFDEIAFKQIEQFFAKRNRPMPACNRKQAMLPQGSVRLENHWGTAPGFALQHGRCWFAFVPGVPSEMRNLFQHHIQPMMNGRFVLRPNKLITIKTVGIGESDLQQRIQSIGIPAQVQLGFRAEIGEVQTKLLFPADYPQGELESLVHLMAAKIGDAVFTVDGLGVQTGDLAFTVDQLMTEKGYTLSIVENFSQGLLAAKMIGVKWLLNAVFERSVATLTENLAVNNNPDDPTATAEAIANALQKKSGADMVLIQLAPRGYRPDPNETTTITNTLLVKDEYGHTVHTMVGDISRKQHQAALFSLDLLRRYLQGKELAG